MLSQVVGLGPVSGQAAIVIPVINGARNIELQLTATAATTATFKVSRDGTTFVASNIGPITATPGQDATAVLKFNDEPYKQDAGPIFSYQVTLSGSGYFSMAIENEMDRGR